jgi:predicted nucleotidyltransferase
MVLRPAAELRAEARAEQRDALDAARRLATRVRAELGATDVYLFGSRARTSWRYRSDVDVFVISDRFEGLKPWERWTLIEALWDGPVNLQPHGLTAVEFENARGKGGLVDMATADGMVELV